MYPAAASLVLVLSWLAFAGAARAARPAQRPNFLFILTDDQDDHMQSLEYMPHLHKLVQQQGTTYTNHYCTVALCCPSRVNLWTGRASHNTNITDIVHPYGGYPRIVEVGVEKNLLAHWMQDAGYNTYYTGKMWNMHTVSNYNSPPQSGFNGSAFLLDPYTYTYWNASITHNGAPPESLEGKYSTDVVSQKAQQFLREGLARDEPWFLTAAPIAPHSDVLISPPNYAVTPPPYPDRHAHLFKDYKIPRTANFNPEKPSGVGWIRDLERYDELAIEYFDEYQRARLRSLQAVDEMVRDLYHILEEQGALENTYIIYTTDNGYHIGQHRLAPGKQCGFETDIHIPMVIRGPGLAAGQVFDGVTSHTDVAPTIMELAGLEQREEFDGAPFPTSADAVAGTSVRQEHAMIEHWGVAVPEGRYGKYGNYNRAGGVGESTDRNTYKSIRLQGPGYSLYYSVWCHGEKEYYDVTTDPDQVNNYLGAEQDLLPASYHIHGRSLDQIVNRLDALLMVLKTCVGRTCVEPWRVLHPNGKVKTLEGALRKDFDAFYVTQPKVNFERCELGYLKDLESPHNPNIYIDEAYAGDHDEL